MKLRLSFMLLALALVAPAARAMDSAQADLVEMLDRRSKLAADDVRGHLALARWCRDKELWRPMADLAREVLAIDPESRNAYALLREYDEKVPLPDEDDTAAALQAECEKRMAHPFKTRQSRHFLVAYDTTDLFVSQRAAALEKAYDSFLFWFNMRQLRPMFLEHRLVVILFKSRDDYLTYARVVDKSSMGWAAGYYSQRTNRCTFYDDSSGPEAQDVAEQVDTLKAQAKVLTTKINQAAQAGQTGLVNALSAERNVITDEIAKITNHTDNMVTLINNVKTVHEACHALAFNTGIQKRLVDYPLWLAEGLACSFETEDRQGQRGPGIVNTTRLGTFKTALKAGTAMSLEDLLTLTPEQMTDKNLGLFYAEGWALFHWLYTHDRPGLEKYLQSYLTQRGPAKLPPETQRKLFTDAFGPDLPGLEKRWLAYFNDLPTRGL